MNVRALAPYVLHAVLPAMMSPTSGKPPRAATALTMSVATQPGAVMPRALSKNSGYFTRNCAMVMPATLGSCLMRARNQYCDTADHIATISLNVPGSRSAMLTRRAVMLSGVAKSVTLK